MSRNWGIISSRASSGGMDTDAAATRDEIHPRDSNVHYLPAVCGSKHQPNSRASRPELFLHSDETAIHPFELGSHLLFLALLCLPPVIVGGIAIGYLAFVF